VFRTFGVPISISALSEAQAMAFQSHGHILTTLDTFEPHLSAQGIAAFEELEEVSFDTIQCPSCIVEDNLRFYRGILVLAMMLAGKTDVAADVFRLDNKGKDTEYLEDWICRLAVEIQRSPAEIKT
jgi:hypothetical protein